MSKDEKTQLLDLIEKLVAAAQDYGQTEYSGYCSMQETNDSSNFMTSLHNEVKEFIYLYG